MAAPELPGLPGGSCPASGDGGATLGKEVARIQGADEAGLRAALDKAGCPPPKNDIF